MTDIWLNPAGFSSIPVLGKADLWDVTFPAAGAIFFRQDDLCIRPVTRGAAIRTDGCSAPRWLRWWPKFAPTRFFRSGMLHDDGYRTGRRQVSRDDGQTWATVQCSKTECDVTLERGVHAERGSDLTAAEYWWAVHIAGIPVWAKYRAADRIRRRTA